MRIEIEYVPIDSITEYPNNAKMHPEEQIEQIKESIREFGFNDPIAIWKNGEIIEGHGRFQAAKELHMKKVPIIRLDKLSNKKRRAYMLVHNQLTMNSGYDKEILDLELGSIKDIDMEQFGFELPEIPEIEEDDGWYGDERERTVRAVNLEDFDAERSAGFYQMPIIKAVQYEPDDLISFNYVMNTDAFDKGVHFFIDDYQFERVWNEPHRYMPRLQKFDCCLTPDFSLYLDMPIAMQIWNVYRSRLIGQIMQDYGIKVIPTLSWSTPESYKFCFDGIEQGGTVAVSTVGVMRDKLAQDVWNNGMQEAIKRLKPSLVIVYGKETSVDFKDVNVKYMNTRRGWQ